MLVESKKAQTRHVPFLFLTIPQSQQIKFQATDEEVGEKDTVLSNDYNYLPSWGEGRFCRLEVCFY